MDVSIIKRYIPAPEDAVEGDGKLGILDGESLIGRFISRQRLGSREKVAAKFRIFVVADFVQDETAKIPSF